MLSYISLLAVASKNSTSYLLFLFHNDDNDDDITNKHDSYATHRVTNCKHREIPWHLPCQPEGNAVAFRVTFNTRVNAIRRHYRYLRACGFCASGPLKNNNNNNNCYVTSELIAMKKNEMPRVQRVIPCNSRWQFHLTISLPINCSYY